jgi:hypothetical protein
MYGKDAAKQKDTTQPMYHVGEGQITRAAYCGLGQGYPEKCAVLHADKSSDTNPNLCKSFPMGTPGSIGPNIFADEGRIKNYCKQRSIRQQPSTRMPADVGRSGKTCDLHPPFTRCCTRPMPHHISGRHVKSQITTPLQMQSHMGPKRRPHRLGSCTAWCACSSS